MSDPSRSILDLAKLLPRSCWVGITVAVVGVPFAFIYKIMVSKRIRISIAKVVDFRFNCEGSVFLLLEIKDEKCTDKLVIDLIKEYIRSECNEERGEHDNVHSLRKAVQENMEVTIEVVDPVPYMLSRIGILEAQSGTVVAVADISEEGSASSHMRRHELMRLQPKSDVQALVEGMQHSANIASNVHVDQEMRKMHEHIVATLTEKLKQMQ
jgi:hypothetical protein